jgi:hypothetical protein
MGKDKVFIHVLPLANYPEVNKPGSSCLIREIKSGLTHTCTKPHVAFK